MNNMNGFYSGSRSFDAIVVGSGISGGWAAKELTEAGLSVLLLERGPNVRHVVDYTNATLDPWDQPHGGLLTQRVLERHPVHRRASVFNAMNAHFWVDDLDCPYTEVKPFGWFRGYQLGGRSLTWGRQSYRFSEMDFEANVRDGVAVDWPIRYADLAPWYDHVESFAGISGSLEGLPQLPDGKFMPPMEMNYVEKVAAKRIHERFGGRRRMIIARTANITQPLPGRAPCQYRDACSRGCPFGAYFSTQSSTLPAAVATGRLTLRADSIATEIIFDRATRRARGVRVMDANTREIVDFKARIVFVCASSLNSAWLMMRSATDEWPDGLGSSSGELGRNLMDHHFRCGASGTIEGFEDRYVYGRRPTGIYVPRFRNIGDDRRGYLRGFGYQGGASRLGPVHATAGPRRPVRSR